MKKILALIIAVSALLSTPLAYGIVSLPPPTPSIEPPGSFLSEEQQFKLTVARDAGRKCEENFERCVAHCRVTAIEEGTLDRSPGSCYDKCVQQRKECYISLAFFMGEIKPPTIQLPNGNSPGQGN